MIAADAETLAIALRADAFRSRGRALKNEHGSTLVELALSSAILFSMLFGIMQIGLALYSFHFISNAAREGTRWAMVRGNTCTGCVAAVSDVQSHVKNLGFPGINPANMTVTVSYGAYPAGVTCSPSAACNNPGNKVKVVVQYNFTFAVPFVPQQTFSMSSTSTMIIAQ